ncbi:DegV family protein [Exiguobacterium aestuarii]|uniref:DegV family protein n=1 Tax=Exiguobacterium aestuarii TaxID=273527 RepID=A0ABW2PKY5_9BACL|nr:MULTISPECIES: DegV family protein [Exiguobacterium]MCT4787181.1 DegV family protein [Exiguobacterium aestuarii]
MFKLITDTGADLTHDQIIEYGLEILPLGVIIDNEEFLDGETIQAKDVYDAMRQGKTPKTFQIEASRIEHCFRQHLEAEIPFLYLAFSGELSGTYQTAVMVGEMLKEEYPDSTFEILDTRTASVGQALFVKTVAEYGQDHTYEETVAYAASLVGKIRHLFTVESLEYLMRGGRVSKASAFIGDLLTILPLLTVEDGKLVPIEKVRGHKKVMRRMVEWTMESKPLVENGHLFIGHGDDLEKAEQFEKMVREHVQPKHITKTLVGSAIGAHTGPGLLVIAYFEA